MKVQKQTADTRTDAETVLTQLIQNQAPSERLAGAISASNRVARQCKDAIVRANPDISEKEVKLRFIELNYGRELAGKVRNFLAGK